MLNRLLHQKKKIVLLKLMNKESQLTFQKLMLIVRKNQLKKKVAMTVKMNQAHKISL